MWQAEQSRRAARRRKSKASGGGAWAGLYRGVGEVPSQVVESRLQPVQLAAWRWGPAKASTPGEQWSRLQPGQLAAWIGGPAKASTPRESCGPGFSRCSWLRGDGDRLNPRLQGSRGVAALAGVRLGVAGHAMKPIGSIGEAHHRKPPEHVLNPLPPFVLQEPAQTREFPIIGVSHIAVLDGIVMNVVEACPEVDLRSDAGVPVVVPHLSAASP